MCIRDRHNNASKIGDGHDSGIRLYQGEDNKWYIALDPTDAGRAWINAADAKDCLLYTSLSERYIPLPNRLLQQ